MATNAIPIREVSYSDTKWTWFQKLVLRRAHPQSILIDCVAVAWFTYFFQAHDWMQAIICVVLARAATFLLATKPDYDRIAETAIGKMALLHLHPTNIIVQTVGIAVALYGLWYHAAATILVGLSVVTLGHWFGWDKVNEAFARE